MIQKMYQELLRGFDWCVVNQVWQNCSTVKYVLPEYFQDLEAWNKRGNGWQEQWNNELMVHIGEEFNYQWMPIGNPKLLTFEEIEQMKNI